MASKIPSKRKSSSHIKADLIDLKDGLEIIFFDVKAVILSNLLKYHNDNGSGENSYLNWRIKGSI